MERYRATPLLFGLAVLLGLWGLASLGLGFRRLARDPGRFSGCDLRYRYEEEQTLFRGQNPYERYFRETQAALAQAGEPGIRARNENWPAAAPSYPPWSFAFGVLLVPPFLPWSFSRIWYALLNAAALALIAWWAFRQGRRAREAESAEEARYHRGVGALLAAMTLAWMPNLYCLTNGQYGILLTAFLLMAVSLERTRPALAGTAGALALIKPHLTAFALIPLALRRRGRAVMTAAGVLLAATAVTWVMTGSDPVHMLVQMWRAGYDFADTSHGLLDLTVRAGGDPRTIGPILNLVGLIAGLFLLIRHRRLDPLDLLGFAGIFGVLWSYHKAYDHGLLIPAAVALARRVARHPSPGGAGALLLFTLPQLLPLRMANHRDWRMELIEIAGWIWALVFLLRKAAVTAEPKAPAELLAPKRAMGAPAEEITL